jgi:nicotinamide riboside transporter PnuC
MADGAQGGSARPEELTVAEYTALRAEILQAQQARMVVLGLIVTLLSGVSSLVLTRTGETTATSSISGLVAFALLTLAIGIHFTGVLTRHMDTMGAYIRVYIEGRYEGAMWETVWTRHRQAHQAARKPRSKLPLGQSKVYALFYGALVIAMVVEYFIADDHESPIRIAIVAVPAIAALVLAADLYLRRWAAWDASERIAQTAPDG